MRSKEQFRPEKKLRIACFHGFGTNGEMMKVQMRHLSRLMEPYAEFIFLDGSHITEKSLVVDPAVHKLIGEANSYSWFNYRNMSEPQLIEASVRHMEGILEKHGPLDGMIGFSQGCAFVHLMLMALNEGMFRSQKIKSLRFTIFVCTATWKWNSLQLKKQIHPINFPTFHMISKSDFMYMFTVASTTKFYRPEVIHHTEGHKIPRLGLQQFEELMKFVRKAMATPPLLGPQAKL